MKLNSIKDVKNLKGKRVLLRAAYDVPLKQRGKSWIVADNTRIEQTLATIKYLLKQECRIVILPGWLGRPNGKVVEMLRMDPVAKELAKILKRPVKKLDEAIGPKVFTEIKKMKPKEILLLENSRFYPEEQLSNKRFAKLLVHGLDLIVFDAFAQVHRAHASTTEITKLLPSYSGLLLEKEIKELSKIIDKPKKPMVIVLGGAKISDKIAVLQQLVAKADYVLVGGGPANVFLKAKGVPIGRSFIEDVAVASHKSTPVKIAKKLLKQHGKKFILPTDFIATNKIDEKGLVEYVNLGAGDKINGRWMFVDIGPETIKNFTKIIKNAKTTFWNGPMGVFEIKQFSEGTKKVAQAIGRNRFTRIVGGGDTESVLSKFNLEDKFTHVSTGGGASLEFLAGNNLPVLKNLVKK